MRLTSTGRFVAVTAVAAAVVGAMTWATVQSATDDHRYALPDAKTATIGQSYVADSTTPVHAHSVVVRLPNGRLHVTVGAPGGVAADDDGADVRAPAGGSLVVVDQHLDTTFTTYPGATYARAATRVVLRADGQDYPVPDVRDRTVLAVHGAHPTLSVAVDFAGVRQRVDVDTGTRSSGTVASALYTTLRSGTTSCGTPVVARPYRLTTAAAPPTCRLDWRRVPYLPGRGWAPAGRAWLLVAATLSGPSVLARSGSGVLSDVGRQATVEVRCGTTSAADTDPRSAEAHYRDQSTRWSCPVGATLPSITVAVGLNAYLGGGPATAAPLTWRTAL